MSWHILRTARDDFLFMYLPGFEPVRVNKDARNIESEKIVESPPQEARVLGVSGSIVPDGWSPRVPGNICRAPEGNIGVVRDHQARVLELLECLQILASVAHCGC